MVLRVYIDTRANISRGPLFCRVETRRLLHRRAPCLIVLASKQHEVVGGSTLELLVRDCLQVLSIILTDARVVFADDDVIQALVDLGSVTGQLLLRLLDLARVRQLVGASSWNPEIDGLEPLSVHSEWLLFTASFGCDIIRRDILNVVLRSWAIYHELIDGNILTVGGREVS